MALHAPAHQLGTTHHPHVLRNALAFVGVLILAMVLVVAALTVRITPATASSSDKLMTQQMVDFRAGERSIAYPAMLPAVSGDPLQTQLQIEFRAGERAVDGPLPYNGPH